MIKRCLNCHCSYNSSRSDQQFCSSRCRNRYHHGGDFTLTLKKKWFDMILSGEKKEEYREIKPYWEKRFSNYFGYQYDFNSESPAIVWNPHKKNIVFKNGYGKDAPKFTAECTISEGTGKEEWGAVKGEKYFVLTIHRIFNIEERISEVKLNDHQ